MVKEKAFLVIRPSKTIMFTSFVYSLFWFLPLIAFTLCYLLIGDHVFLFLLCFFALLLFFYTLGVLRRFEIFYFFKDHLEVKCLFIKTNKVYYSDITEVVKMEACFFDKSFLVIDCWFFIDGRPKTKHYTLFDFDAMARSINCKKYCLRIPCGSDADLIVAKLFNDISK